MLLASLVLRAMGLSNKLLEQGYDKELWNRLKGSSMVDTGILSNNMKCPSPECNGTYRGLPHPVTPSLY